MLEPARARSDGAAGVEQATTAADGKSILVNSVPAAIPMIRMTMIVGVAPAKSCGSCRPGGQLFPVSSKSMPATAGNRCRHCCSWARLASLALSVRNLTE